MAKLMLKANAKLNTQTQLILPDKLTKLTTRGKKEYTIGYLTKLKEKK